mgnify:CR=1 FL=1
MQEEMPRAPTTHLRGQGGRVERRLVLLHAQDVDVDRPLAHHPYDAHRPRLPDPMHAIDRLTVHLRVEVGIVQHDIVGGGERHAEPARPRRAQEELGPIRRVERRDVDDVVVP